MRVSNWTIIAPIVSLLRWKMSMARRAARRRPRAAGARRVRRRYAPRPGPWRSSGPWMRRSSCERSASGTLVAERTRFWVRRNPFKADSGWPFLRSSPAAWSRCSTSFVNCCRARLSAASVCSMVARVSGGAPAVERAAAASWSSAGPREATRTIAPAALALFEPPAATLLFGSSWRAFWKNVCAVGAAPCARA